VSRFNTLWKTRPNLGARFYRQVSLTSEVLVTNAQSLITPLAARPLAQILHRQIPLNYCLPSLWGPSRSDAFLILRAAPARMADFRAQTPKSERDTREVFCLLFNNIVTTFRSYYKPRKVANTPRLLAYPMVHNRAVAGNNGPKGRRILPGACPAFDSPDLFSAHIPDDHGRKAPIAVASGK
jgi:hypothetical protein